MRHNRSAKNESGSFYIAQPPSVLNTPERLGFGRRFLRQMSFIVALSMVNMTCYPAIAQAQAQRTGELPVGVPVQFQRALTHYQQQLYPATYKGSMASDNASAGCKATERPVEDIKRIELEEALKELLPGVFQADIHPGQSGWNTAKAQAVIELIKDNVEMMTRTGASDENHHGMIAAHSARIDPAFEQRQAQFLQLADQIILRPADQQAYIELARFFSDHPNKPAGMRVDPANLPYQPAKDRARLPIEDVRLLKKLLAQQSTSNNQLIGKQSANENRPFELKPDAMRRIQLKDLPKEATQLKTANIHTLSAKPQADDLSETDDIQLSPAIRAKAAELGYNPYKIYTWVRNTIDYHPTYGSIQGSDMTLATRRGNAYDIASLTVALLRASGIPARYVYGTAEVSASSLQNWTGGAASPEAAQNLISQGGIPNVALVSGGQIDRFRLEHIWVETYIRFYPDRGARYVGNPSRTINEINALPRHNWVPLDASYKQFSYEAPPDITTAAGIDLAELKEAALSTASTGPSDTWIQGLNTQAFNEKFEDAQHLALGYLAQQHPNITPEELQGKKQTIPERLPYLAGALPYTATPLMRLSALPASLRWSVEFSYYASSHEAQQNNPSVQKTIPLTTLGLKQLGIVPVPASQADADTWNNLVSQGATQFNLASIQVKPQLQLEGENLLEAPSQRIGDAVFWGVTLQGPGQTPRTAYYQATTGDYLILGINAIGMDMAQYDMRRVLHNQSSVIDNLQQVALGYWMQHDLYDDILARQQNMQTLRLPSAGVFAHRLNVRYFFGIPRTGYYLGRSMDVKQGQRALAGGNAEQKKNFMIQSGVHGSYAEGSTFDYLFQRSPGSAISAANILQTRQAQGDKIYKIDSDTLNNLAHINTTAAVKADIRNAVHSGLIAVIAENEMTQGTWRGAGYYLIDPDTGAGAYMIDGGYAGGDEGDDCDLTPSAQPAGSLVNSIIQVLAIIIALLVLAALIWWLGPLIGGILATLGIAGAASAQTMPPVNGLSPNLLSVWNAMSNGRPWPATAPSAGMSPPGDCTRAQHDALEDIKENICGMPARCSGKICNRSEVERRVQLHEDCISARLKIMDTCFKGGDARHWNHIEERLAGIDRCYRCYVKFCH